VFRGSLLISVFTIERVTSVAEMWLKLVDSFTEGVEEAIELIDWRGILTEVCLSTADSFRGLCSLNFETVEELSN
jgi:hypothetical protein